jgi:coenzyme PQQ precursor peptide PqqA
MAWEAPEFVEVRMDAEINSYQDEFGPDREQDDRF